MSKHPKSEDKSERHDEFFVAYVTDSREKIEQPTGKVKDLFETMVNEVRRTRANNSAKNVNISKDDRSAKPSSRSVESREND